MTTMTSAVPVEEYLATSYPDGDREYLDGQVVERNMGEFRHASVQSLILTWLFNHYSQFWAVVECRFQITRSRYRIPDVCLGIGPRPESGPLLDPPFLVVEVLSPDDRFIDLQEKVDDYLNAGVQYVWVVNPITKRGYVYTSEGSREAKDGVLRTENPTIEVPLSEVLK
jgi:Uma2 family endonuclease